MACRPGRAAHSATGRDRRPARSRLTGARKRPSTPCAARATRCRSPRRSPASPHVRPVALRPSWHQPRQDPAHNSEKPPPSLDQIAHHHSDWHTIQSPRQDPPATSVRLRRARCAFLLNPAGPGTWLLLLGTGSGRSMPGITRERRARRRRITPLRSRPPADDTEHFSLRIRSRRTCDTPAPRRENGITVRHQCQASTAWPRRIRPSPHRHCRWQARRCPGCSGPRRSRA